MRSVLGLFFASTLASAALLVPTQARAADDDLPGGTDPPRILPVAIVDGYFAYHDTPPASRNATLMTTAVRHDEFQLNLAAIGFRLEHAKLIGTVVLQAGTSVDALYPTSTRLISGSTIAPGPSNPQVWKHIQEANVGYRLGSDLAVIAGVFTSHLGNEGFVSTGNWNYARAMIADATPYYLAGAKIVWRAHPNLTLTGLIYNGWLTYDDLGKSKSGGLRIEWKPSDKVSLSDGAHVGPALSGIRIYDDLTFRWQIVNRLDLAVQASFGVDKPSEGSTKQVYGAAAWLRWMIGDTTYFALRGEYLADDHGMITGAGARQPVTNGPIGQKLTAGTFTLGWMPHPSFLARLEVMQRMSDVEYFAGGSVAPSTDPNTGTSDDAKKRSTTVTASVAFSY